jgi:two-component system response regulator HydG
VKVLVIDDQRSARRVLRHMLQPLEVEVVEAASLAEAQQAIETQSFDLLLVDIRLSDEPTDRGGLELLRWLRAGGRATPAVMVTSSTEMAEIRAAMRLGAQDYVLKDELEPAMIVPIVQGIAERAALRGEVGRLREQVERGWGLAALVGSSEAMQRVRQLVERVAESDVPLLIRGDTGTGKERVARALHETGRRRGRFLAVNCAALPAQLIESLLFGHEKGAFTGASRRMRGHFEMAGDGTLLLDEIAEMPVELQAKLLRVLEDKKFLPLGATREQPLHARVIAATHTPIEERMADGRFRQDLFYRLNVVSIMLPPLWQRAEDIPELLQVFASELARPLRFSEAAVEWLSRRRWPGNVRELRNLVDRLALLSPTEDIDVPILNELAGDEPRPSGAEIERMARAILALPARLGSKLDVIERAILHHAIEASGGNMSAAARLIGMDRKTLERHWERLGVDDETSE